jgi:hypothetical protein
MFNKIKTKYFLVAYNIENGSGNATFEVIGKNPYLDLNHALNWIEGQDLKFKNPVIINIIEINKKQYDEFHEWCEKKRENN